MTALYQTHYRSLVRLAALLVSDAAVDGGRTYARTDAGPYRSSSLTRADSRRWYITGGDLLQQLIAEFGIGFALTAQASAVQRDRTDRRHRPGISEISVRRDEPRPPEDLSLVHGLDDERSSCRRVNFQRDPPVPDHVEVVGRFSLTEDVVTRGEMHVRTRSLQGARPALVPSPAKTGDRPSNSPWSRFLPPCRAPGYPPRDNASTLASSSRHGQGHPAHRGGDLGTCRRQPDPAWLAPRGGRYGPYSGGPVLIAAGRGRGAWLARRGSGPRASLRKRPA